jgi:hypothetical protein
VLGDQFGRKREIEIGQREFARSLGSGHGA